MGDFIPLPGSGRIRFICSSDIPSPIHRVVGSAPSEMMKKL